MGKKNLFWQVSVPLFLSSGKKKKYVFQYFWFDCILIINQEWVLVSEQLAKEAHQSFKHKSCT